MTLKCTHNSERTELEPKKSQNEILGLNNRGYDVAADVKKEPQEQSNGESKKPLPPAGEIEARFNDIVDTERRESNRKCNNRLEDVILEIISCIKNRSRTMKKN